ncbi:MAG: ribonuclease III [Clostridia bacterium]|nr:ribonuclease III [Clostridia bacterium]
MNLGEIENLIGYVYRDKNLLTTAFTHATYANEKGVESNERLEFLGDALVDFVTGESFYKEYPDYQEGKLTAIRKKAVCRDALSEAKGMGELCPFLRLAKGVEINPKIRADLFEAIVASIYLDGGFDIAKTFVLSRLDIKVESLDKKREDYKSALLELGRKKNMQIEFRELDVLGPDHARVFVYGVFINGEEFSSAQGTSKKRAEQTASKIAIQRISNLKNY